MDYLSLCLSLLSAFAFTSTAALQAGSLLAVPAPTVESNDPLITPPPLQPAALELRKRAASSSSSSSSSSPAYDPATICGYDKQGITARCLYGLACKATILPDRDAYVYCSDSATNSQYIGTTAYPNWPSGRTCPTSAYCCGEPSPAVGTQYFLSAGYAVTGFVCEEQNWRRTFSPVANLLNPASFSASLAKLPPSTTPSPTSTTATASPNGGSGGLSSGAKIGIGAGIGGGVGLLLIALVAFIFIRRRQKKKEREESVAEVSQHGTTYYPKPFHSPESQYSHSVRYGSPPPPSQSPPPQNFHSVPYNSGIYQPVPTHDPYAYREPGSGHWPPPQPQQSATAFSAHTELNGDGRFVSHG